MKSTVASNDRQAEKNLETVLVVYDEMINQHNPKEAVKKYLRLDYIQHNPLIPTGQEGLGIFFAGVAEAFPKVRVKVHNAIAIGEWVWTHVNFLNIKNNNEGDLGIAGVDIFRFDAEGKIAEHWDTLQVIEDLSKAQNTHGMF